MSSFLRNRRDTVKHFPHFLLTATSLLLLAAPAHASRLESWRFDTNSNQLEFTTDEDVQPRAQLISDPTRLVIDLPGIVLGRPASTQSYSGAIRSVRLGQFDRGAARLVVELAPGYTIDPNQVRFRGLTARQWTVQLPTPQLLPADAASASPVGGVSGNGNQASSTQIQGVQVTPDGIFVRTNGGSPDLEVRRSSDRSQITVDVQGATLALSATRNLLVNRLGVSRITLSQLQASPPIARLTLNVDRSSPDWQATTSSSGGLVLLPSGNVASGTDSRPSSSPPPLFRPGALATIESVALENNDTQLVIRANQPLKYSTGWDRATGTYRVTVNSAQLAKNVKGPQLEASSPVLKLRLRQETANTAVILVTPASGVLINDTNQPNQQTLALQLQRSRLPIASLPNPSTASIPVPNAPRTDPLPPRSTAPIPDVPRATNGRPVVIIDPGHGGPDPGAIGIGGLQEKGIVLDIGQKVAAMLEQQGIQAIITRPDDRDLDLEPRVQLAERANATVFVSIHANSINLSRQDISGLETYYYQSGLNLARVIHQSVLEGTGIQDRGVRSARFYVLRKTSMPSVLVEVGFVTGRDDAAKLSDANYRSRMATAIARGILRYLGRSS
ncbi:N-acetylmuramoyl-L-alanine amidase [Stenomitos frigidus ULC18]|uniref:N-acetylmuramoyl-L-alanine amidase n=2 Tax=Stenomitos TaxID=1844270 RepID=A0A2T1DZ39_9CYAN|nr:N-acetylmuramoyl-L-alanine amidase [Stenomitos frigidus ULC18]